MRLLLALLVALTIGCTEFHNFVNTGSTPGGLDDAVTDVVIDPSRFDMTNGERRPGKVYAFVGDNKLDEDAFHAVLSVSGKSCATVESPQGSSFTLKAESPGDCELVARVGTKEARALVHVVAASE